MSSGANVTDKDDIQGWWTANPMTYGSTHGTPGYGNEQLALGSTEFFERLDRTFYGWNDDLHGQRPFDRLFPYSSFGAGARVLEIGCGLGTMAMNWAKNGADVTAVDLNQTSIDQTRRRFELFGLKGRVQQMDGNELQFDDASFDYVYSWGVLHHSPNLQRSLSEMMRVLRPGGSFGLMLYSRRSILYGYRIKYLEGFLNRESRFLGPLELASRYTDGAEEEGNPHTWPVTDDEVRQMLQPHAKELRFKRLGGEVGEIFEFMLPGLGSVLPAWAIRPWSRLLGWSLWVDGQRR